MTIIRSKKFDNARAAGHTNGEQTMINRLLYKLTAGLPARLIKLDGVPYIERYYLGTLLGVTFYLHRFVSSDSERHLHNHPWTNGAALILAGGYVEERVIDLCPFTDSGCITESKYKRWWNRVDCNTFHRISDAKRGTWTLFMHGQRVRLGDGRLKGWGFLGSAAPWSHGKPNPVTVFTPYAGGEDKPEYARWWLDAPKGRDVGREL